MESPTKICSISKYLNLMLSDSHLGYNGEQSRLSHSSHRNSLQLKRRRVKANFTKEKMVKYQSEEFEYLVN
jgi:hypothetical protein